jgi:hypothetical protein
MPLCCLSSLSQIATLTITGCSSGLVSTVSERQCYLPTDGTTALLWSTDYDAPICAAPDTKPPVLTVPANSEYAATSSAGFSMTVLVSATDDVTTSPRIKCINQMGSVTQIVTPQSSFTFPIGTSVTLCVARDQAGNVAAQSFSVIVDPAQIAASSLAITSVTCNQQSTVSAVLSYSNGGPLLPSGTALSAIFTLSAVDTSLGIADVSCTGAAVSSNGVISCALIAPLQPSSYTLTVSTLPTSAFQQISPVTSQVQVTGNNVDGITMTYSGANMVAIGQSI